MEKNYEISLYFLEWNIIRVLFEEFRSIRSRIRKRRRRAHSKASNKFVRRNRSRLKTRKGSQDRDNSAPYLLRSVRECVEKYICNRSTASLLYACHANAYARHVRFPGVTAPSLVVIRVPRLLPALARPRKTRKKKKYLSITDRVIESVLSYPIISEERKYLLGHTSYVYRAYEFQYLQLYWNNFCFERSGMAPNFIDRRGVGKVLINGWTNRWGIRRTIIGVK